MATTEDKNSKKMADVTKPGKTTPNTTARPVIVGHKPLLKQDPMVNGSSDEEVQEQANKEQLDTNHTAKVIEPLKEESPKDDETKPEKTDSTDDTKETENSTTDEDKPQSEEAAVVDAVAEQAGSKKKETELSEEEKKKQEEINQLIEEKKYFVPIKIASHKRNTRSAVIAVIVLLVVAGIYLAADAGAIKLPFSLPFNFIKDKSAPAASNLQAISNTPAKPATQQPTPKTPLGTTTVGTVITQKDAKFTIDNKYSWKVTETYSSQPLPLVSGSLTFSLPSGAQLVFNFDAGGRGGACNVQSTDQPYRAGNTPNCSTKEILSAEKIALDEKARNLLDPNPSDVWLEHLKFATPEGKVSYWTVLTWSVDFDTKSNKLIASTPVLNKPTVGFYTPDFDSFSAKSGYDYYITTKGLDQTKSTYFTNADVKQIEDVLRTFRLVE